MFLLFFAEFSFAETCLHVSHIHNSCQIFTVNRNSVRTVPEVILMRGLGGNNWDKNVPGFVGILILLKSSFVCNLTATQKGTRFFVGWEFEWNSSMSS